MEQKLSKKFVIFRLQKEKNLKKMIFSYLIIIKKKFKEN